MTFHDSLTLYMDAHHSIKLAFDIVVSQWRDKKPRMNADKFTTIINQVCQLFIYSVLISLDEVLH